MVRKLQWVFFLFISAFPSFGMDLEVSSQVGNLYWAPTRGNDLSGYAFKGMDYFWNLQGSVTQELGDGLTFKGGLESDPVLRNRLYSQLGFVLDNLTLKFTPFLGALNSSQKWFNPGLQAMVEYTWPGLMFARGGFLTTFAPVSKSGDYYLSGQSAAFGLLVENGIISFNIEDKSATFRSSDVLTTVDASTKYWLDTEMFLKNFPLHWAILSGYQITSRSYVATSEVVTPVHSALMGARFSWDFGGGTLAYSQVESAFFTTGWDSTVLSLSSTALIFQLSAGVRYHW